MFYRVTHGKMMFSPENLRDTKEMGTQYATLNARRLYRLYLAIPFPSVPGIIGMPSVQRPSRGLMPCIPIRHLTSLYCPASQSIGMHGTNPGTVTIFIHS